MPDLSELNWWAILVSTVVAGGLGAVWYSLLLFGPARMSALGTGEGEIGPTGGEMAGRLFSGWGRKLYAIQTSCRALYLVLMGGI